MATEAMVALLQRVAETLESIKHTSSISAAKLEFIEKRQCDSGEGTDASRYIDNWSRSTSAHVNSAQVLEDPSSSKTLGSSTQSRGNAKRITRTRVARVALG